MATAKKPAAKKVVAKKVVPAKAAVKATPKAAAKAPLKAATKPATKAAAPAKVAAPASLKPIKTAFNKTGLVAFVSENSGVDAKAVKAVLGTLEAAMFASLSKKGAGAFTWPGVMKVVAQQIPAKKARKGINPFTKEEQVFKAKPASVKVKARFFAKTKAAAA